MVQAYHILCICVYAGVSRKIDSWQYARVSPKREPNQLAIHRERSKGLGGRDVVM